MTEAEKAGIAESLEYDPKSLVLKRGDQRTNLVSRALQHDLFKSLGFDA